MLDDDSTTGEAGAGMSSRPLTHEEIERLDLDRRFSIPHFDATEADDVFCDLIDNASDRYRREIADIYFGGVFRFEHDGVRKAYGNVMGVEASEGQIDRLFAIQRDHGIEISLTLNQVVPPPELFTDRRVLDELLDFIGSFYERGLRSCTISSVHLMASGVLHAAFPQMRWKNTVNHRVSDAQATIDLLHLGYDVVQLDRSMNRDLEGLRQVKKAVDRFRENNPDREVQTSLLVYEGCLYRCPFRLEHCSLEAMGEDFDYSGELIPLSCGTWRSTEYRNTPRAVVGSVWVSGRTFKEYADLVDVFKWTGRLTDLGANPIGEDRAPRACYVSSKTRAEHIYDSDCLTDVESELAWAESFGEILENNLEPVSAWVNASIFSTAASPDKSWERFRQWAADSILLTHEGRRLEQVLQTCRNQCWDCHMCESVFGLRPVDSLIRPIGR
jgi:hypothetical protein